VNLVNYPQGYKYSSASIYEEEINMVGLIAPYGEE
jgi:hypothetical protein